MTPVLDALRQDHSNMARVLDVLEAQLVDFNDGARPDFDIIGELLEYCQTYPDLHHHPAEDMIVERIGRYDASAATDLSAEHEELAALTANFADAVARVVGGIEMPRRWFDEQARAFLDFYNQHMRLEEEELFPLAERMLSDADWREIEHRLEGITDPLTAAAGETPFDRLQSLLADDPQTPL